MGDRWLEKELERQLAPVAAPGALWDRIVGSREGRLARIHRRLPYAWVLWPAAAMVILAGVIGMVRWRMADAGEDRFAEREVTLVAKHTGFDLGAGSFEDAREFVKARANIEIDLPKRHPSA